MPTNNYGLRMDNLNKRIREAEMSEENRELLWKFKRDLEVQDYSDGRIYKLLNYLKIMGEHILRKVNVKPKYYESEKESEQAVQYVREACESLTGNFTPSDISDWIKENKEVEIRPEGVGLYLRRIDYTTENRSINGEQMRIVKQIGDS